MAERWHHDPQYSHGYLVPVFALVLLWLRRQRLTLDLSAFRCWGVVLLGTAAALRLVGAYFFVIWLDGLSLLLCLGGIALVVGGGSGLRWAGPAIGFLGFMIPLPYTLQVALGQPLQRIATVASTYVLQTLGLPAVAQGNVILMGELSIGVVEACNGLSMLVVFFALSTAVAMLVERPAWEKAALVASAIPIALLANIIRITMTAVLFEVAGGGVANAVFHDWSGWLMMPLAVGLLGGEMVLMTRLLVEPAGPAGRPLATARLVGRPDRPDTDTGKRWAALSKEKIRVTA
jgi:exosortase